MLLSLVLCMCLDGRLTINSSIEWNWSDIYAVTGDGWRTGGEWQPENCTARYHMAIIIPSRDRDSHLKALLRHLVPILRRQLIHFRIFVVEQVIKYRIMLLVTGAWRQFPPLNFILCHLLQKSSKHHFNSYLFICTVPHFCSLPPSKFLRVPPKKKQQKQIVSGYVPCCMCNLTK